jgi:hypothetical protein
LFILKNWNFDKSWRESKQSYVSKIWIWNGKQHALNERFFLPPIGAISQSGD